MNEKKTELEIDLINFDSLANGYICQLALFLIQSSLAINLVHRSYEEKGQSVSLNTVDSFTGVNKL